MKYLIICVALLFAATTGGNAHEKKTKKVASVVESICDSSSAQKKKFDCAATGTVLPKEPQAPTAESKPRLGFSGNPWAIIGF